MTRTARHPNEPSLTHKLVASLLALNAGLSFGLYVRALFSEHFLWAWVNATDMVINLFCALVMLGLAQIPKSLLPRFWRRPAAVLLPEPLNAQHYLVSQPFHCLFCHQAFAVGHCIALVPLDLQGCGRRNMTFAAHTQCVEAFIEVSKRIEPTQA